MFAITEGTRRIGGKEIPTFQREIISANMLEVEAGTNGYQGGDRSMCSTLTRRA